MCRKNFKSYSSSASCYFMLMGVIAVLITIAALLKVVLIFFTPFEVEK